MPAFRNVAGLAEGGLLPSIFADYPNSHELIGVVVNTYREIPPLAHHPTKARTDSYQESGAWVQEAWSLAPESRRYMSAKTAMHVVDPGDSSIWTALESGAPSRWIRTKHNHRLDNDETTFQIKVGDQIAQGRPWWGYFGVFNLTVGGGKGAAVSYDVGRSNTHYVAYLDDEGHVVTGHSSNTLPLAFDYHTSTFDVVEWLCIRWDEGRGRLILWTQEAASVYERTSTNEGKDWSVATTIAGTAAKPCGVVGKDNTRYVYWIDGTAIKGRLYDASDTALMAAFTAVASGVDDVGIACDERTIGNGKLQIVLWYVASGTLTEVYSNDGVIFA